MRSALRKLFRRDGRNLGIFVVTNTLVTMLLFYILEKTWGADYSFLDSFYWTGVTIPTLGYGDILPTLAATKIITVWIALSSFVCFAIGTALLAGHFIENPFENEVNDDNDDQILMLGLICAHLNIEVPDSVEELHGKATFYDQHS